MPPYRRHMKVIKPNKLQTDGAFSRASSATYTDLNGILRYAAVNEPRFQFIDSVYKGLLKESSGTNLLPWSYTPDSSNSSGFWSLQGSMQRVGLSTGVDASTNSAVDYKGTTSTASVRGSVPLSVGTFCLSVFAKRVSSSAFSGNILSITCKHADGSDFKQSLSASSVGVTWKRYSLVVSNELLSTCTVDLAENLGADTEVQLSCVQVESGTLSSYIKTINASTASRAADVISGAGLLWTNAVNTDPDWVSSTNYAVGAIVTYAGSVYESIKTPNTAVTPGSNDTYWLYRYPDNKHAAFDSSVSTSTKATEYVDFLLKPGQADSLAILEVDGADVVYYSILDPSTGNILFEGTSGLSGVVISNWYDYFTADLTAPPRRQIMKYGIPKGFPDMLLSIRVKGQSATQVSVGLISIGILQEIGDTQYGASSGITDYSVKSADDYGNITLVERPYRREDRKSTRLNSSH